MKTTVGMGLFLFTVVAVVGEILIFISPAIKMNFTFTIYIDALEVSLLAGYGLGFLVGRFEEKPLR